MNSEVKEMWVKALRSGEHNQTKFGLRSKKGFCCLGVLCEIAVQHKIIPPSQFTGNKKVTGSFIYDGSSAYLPNKVILWAELTDSDPYIKTKYPTNSSVNGGYRLSYYNDDGVSFEKIADLIEENL